MKFSDGYWLTRDGYEISTPKEAYDHRIDEHSLTVYGPVKAIQKRGDTLDTRMLTVRFSSPFRDVIRVQVFHYKGRSPKQPEFKLQMTDTKPLVSNTDNELTLKSGRLSVTVNQQDWRYQFSRDGQKLTGSEPNSLAYIAGDDGRTFIREQLDIGVGEMIYGLGERFTAFVKNGQSVDIWNKDGGTSTEQAYKNVPFYLSNKGYGVFVNHPELVSYEIGSEVVSKAQFSVEGESLDYFIISGSEPKEVLKNYTRLTGKPALPPPWSFGLWLSTSFTTDYSEETVTRFIDGMKERDIPLSVFHFDCFWMKEFEWCNFEWDERFFQNPQEMLGRLKDKGLKICVWINPYIAQKSKLFEEGKENGYFLMNARGDVWQWDRWQAGMAIVDFTNPKARDWYCSKLERLLDMGVDCFKTDFGERIPADAVYFDGSDPEKMHNYYSFLYNKTVFDLLKEKRGEQEAVVFARSATAGCQQFPVHWGGDCFASYDSMAESLRGGLSLSLSGFGFWSHDIGGFESTATADLYKRWTAFGLLSTHSRLHGSESYRVPWLFDEEASDVMRYFVKLKHRLMPYLYAAAYEAHTEGVPLMRAMLLEFPLDRTCDFLDRQYMLGDALLVAPIFREDGAVSYYLPKGTWTHLLTGEDTEGGEWKEEQYGYMGLPLFVRENTLLPLGCEADRPDYDYLDDVSFCLYHLKDGCTAERTIYNERCEVMTIKAFRKQNTITVQAQGTQKKWRLLIRGHSPVSTVINGSLEALQEGSAIRPKEADRDVVIFF
ncbi:MULTISPECIES: alpha-xylosidase [unclassified Bacillus (in: firmicutes)]|uniref:alpha-xylosidase n=1 Tax=unclassified Bacillus (in: firmicutes) TaxID=185979 RepID=UPI0004014313|nr:MULTISPECIES: alpha-xylosidase [unclassified Bacillus (in: firmicutes)]QHZ45595.1 alpha-xylosidase [Bacillus sp. NSP9.1]WFA04599.1 alpha-xylosidase [Bacillus sp. HSf4]